ncbi:unnamed protein product, partial [Rotaria sp. Silwood1]
DEDNNNDKQSENNEPGTKVFYFILLNSPPSLARFDVLFSVVTPTSFVLSIALELRIMKNVND